MQMKKLPKIIQELCLDFSWDNERVWQLRAPVEKMNISELEWQFGVPFWDLLPQRYVLTPNEVLNDREKHAVEYQRILDADLIYPIDIMQNKIGLWECLDGLHRVAKAKMRGYQEVAVRKIPSSEIPNIQK